MLSEHNPELLVKNRGRGCRNEIGLVMVWDESGELMIDVLLGNPNPAVMIYETGGMYGAGGSGTNANLEQIVQSMEQTALEYGVDFLKNLQIKEQA